MADPNPSQPTDPRLLQIAPTDNVAVATTTIASGESVMIDGVTIALDRTIPSGHKLALAPIVAGEKIIKYGLPIGVATANIDVGEHVHTHNLKSDYYPTYTLDGGNPFLTDV